MKWLSTFVSILFFAQVTWGNAAIFSGSDVKILKPNLNMNGQGKIMSGTVDPTATATSAAVGTVYLNTSNGNLYKKLDAGSSTNWEQIRQDNKNQLKNPSASTGVDSWTNGGGTFVRTTTSGEYKSAPAGFSWVASGGGEVITSNSWAIPTNGTVNAVGYCYFAGAATTYDLELYTNGSTIEQAVDIPASTDFQKVEISFVAKSGNSYQIRARSYAGGTELNWDDCYLGENIGLTNVSQARIFGTWSLAATANCGNIWSTTTASTPLTLSTADTDCTEPTTTGSLSSAGKVVGFTAAQLPVGDYEIEGQIPIYCDTTVAGARVICSNYWSASGVTITQSDGTLDFNDNYTGGNKSIGYFKGPKGRFTITTPLTNVTFYVNIIEYHASGQISYNTGAASNAVLKYWPSGNQLAATNTATLDEWQSYTPTGSWVTNTTYAGKWRRVGDSAEYDVAVTATGVPTNTGLTINLASGHTIDTAKMSSSGDFERFGECNIRDVGTAIHPCAVNYTSTTAVQVGVMNSASTFTVLQGLDNTTPMTWASGDHVHLKFRVPIVGWTSKVPVPVLVGSVTSNSAGAERVERAKLNCDAASAITSQSGSWISTIGNRANGCSVTIASGIFSAAPTCSWTLDGNITNAYPLLISTSSTSLGIYARRQDDAAYVDQDGYLICMGPR